MSRLPACALLFGSFLLLGACGGGAPATEEQAAAEASTPSAEGSGAAQGAVQATSGPVGQPTDSAPLVRRFLPMEAHRATRAERFPHENHVGINCRVCHEAPTGHTTHADVGCPNCHRSAAFITDKVLTKADCLTCHHGGTNGRACLDCHKAPPEPLVVEQQLKFSVWNAPRTRSLPFDHARHASQECRTCHKAMPNLKPTEPCATCHEQHHQADRRCMTCHRQPPAGVHTLDAHLTCNTAGCHNEPVTERMTEGRSVCLVCHQDKESHEPGRICAQCHQVRPGADAAKPEGEPVATGGVR